MIAVDWQDTFLPAVLAWLNGGNPYAGAHPLYNAPWVMFPLIPFAVLPYEIGRLALVVVSLAALAFVATRRGASPAGMVLFLLAAPVFDSYFLGNVEWLVLLGLIMPRPLGILFLMLKPQETIALIAFWTIEAWRDRGPRGVLRLALPGAAALAASIVFFGAWPLQSLAYFGFTDSWVNYSAFPWSVPIGAALVIAALRTRNDSFALAASPMFFPVVTPQVWCVVFLAMAQKTKALGLASAAAWLYVLVDRWHVIGF